MPTDNPPPDIQTIEITAEKLTFNLVDGRSISVPLLFYPTLALATSEERADYEITHSSIYWPRLDCDISSAALLRGAKERSSFAAKAYARAADSHAAA